MTYVVDASVAIKWFVREDLHDQALLLLDDVEALQAPDLIVSELTNIAWKKCIRSEIERAQAQVIATAIRQYIPTLHPSTELTERALEIALALNHPVYDCLYLACAEAVSGILITADKRLQRAVKNTPYDASVQHLTQFDQGLAPLRISAETVKELVRLSKLATETDRNIKNELRGGTKEWRKLTKEERQKFGSMHLENIRRIIRGLSRDGCIDLFSLLGGEEPDTANWNSRRQDASEWLKESLDEEQLNYLAFSTVHTFHPDALPRIVEKIVRTKARNPP